MDMTSENRAAVAEAVAKQLAHLRTNTESVARAADVSANTVRRVLSAQSWPQMSTRTRLELALGWTPGSFERIATRGTHLTGLEGYSTRMLIVELLRRDHEMDRRAGR